jgi:hypothetical protein
VGTYGRMGVGTCRRIGVSWNERHRLEVFDGKCRLFCVWAGFLLVKGTSLGFSFLSGNEQQTGAQTYP